MNKHFSDTKSESFLSDQQRMVRDTARKLGRDVLDRNWAYNPGCKAARP